MDYYTAWLWERRKSELLGKSFFDILSKESHEHCRAKFGSEIFQTKSEEISKEISYSIEKVFECNETQPKYGLMPKVLTSQFTRVILANNSNHTTQCAIHIKTRLASAETSKKIGISLKK